MKRRDKTESEDEEEEKGGHKTMTVEGGGSRSEGMKGGKRGEKMDLLCSEVKDIRRDARIRKEEKLEDIKGKEFGGKDGRSKKEKKVAKVESVFQPLTDDEEKPKNRRKNRENEGDKEI